MFVLLKTIIIASNLIVASPEVVKQEYSTFETTKGKSPIEVLISENKVSVRMVEGLKGEIKSFNIIYENVDGKEEKIQSKEGSSVEVPKDSEKISVDSVEVVWSEEATDEEYKIGRNRETDGRELFYAKTDKRLGILPEKEASEWYISAEAKERAEKRAKALKKFERYVAGIREHQELALMVDAREKRL